MIGGFQPVPYLLTLQSDGTYAAAEVVSLQDCEAAVPTLPSNIGMETSTLETSGNPFFQQQHALQQTSQVQMQQLLAQNKANPQQVLNYQEQDLNGNIMTSQNPRQQGYF